MERAKLQKRLLLSSEELEGVVETLMRHDMYKMLLSHIEGLILQNELEISNKDVNADVPVEMFAVEHAKSRGRLLSLNSVYTLMGGK